MKTIRSIFALFLINIALAWSAQAQNLVASGLSQYYFEENNAIQWQQRYNAAPSGSWDEQQARQSRDAAIQRALAAVSPYAFQGMQYQQIEALADQENQKFNAAASGSALESMYRQVRDTAYQAFNTELLNYVNYFSNDWRQINDLAAQLDQKYNAAPSGSAKEHAYDQARRSSYQRIPQAVDQEIYRIWNYADVENLAEYFSNLYNAAPSGSLKETTYDQVRRSAYNQAFNKFSQQAYSLSQQELWQIQENYNQKFNAAPSGSLKESYFRQIRDLARSLIRN